MINISHRNNKFLLELEELLLDPILGEILTAPRLLGEHTFSTRCLKRLKKSLDFNGTKYIVHPFTRSKHYIDSIKKIPKNHMLAHLLVILFYSKNINLEDLQFKNLLCYLIELLLIEQRKFLLNNDENFIQSEYFFTFRNQLKDVIFKKIIEFLVMTTKIEAILSENNTNSLINSFSKPNQIHLNHILFLAIKFNHPLLAKVLLKNIEVNLQIKDPKGKTLLFWACYHKQFEVAKILIQLGAEIFSTIFDQNLQLYLKYSRRIAKFLAILSGNPLLNADLSPDFISNSTNTCLLHYNFKKSLNNSNFNYNQALEGWHLVAYKKGKALRLNYI